MPRLGVNIDHIATLREARKTTYPDPVESLKILVECGVDQVTCHLREDRRHISDNDLSRLIKDRPLPVNLEMAPTAEMVHIALKAKPDTCTLVPEKRQEITTEGGLNLEVHQNFLKEQIPLLKKAGIRVSLFIDPDLKQTRLAAQFKADAVEFHTGTYCEAFGTNNEKTEFDRLKKAATFGKKPGLKIFAGHGLTLENLPSLLKIPEIEEYNIGHSIIARAVFVGLKEAIGEIRQILC